MSEEELTMLGTTQTELVECIARIQVQLIRKCMGFLF